MLSTFELQRGKVRPNCCEAILRLAVLALIIPFGSLKAEPTLRTEQPLELALAPVALYPDDVLVKLLAAAAFPDQIAEAAMLVRTPDDLRLAAEQGWVRAVQTLASCPELLQQLYQNLDWSSRVGREFLHAPDAVLDVIMKLRSRARDFGNLSDNESVVVTDETPRSGRRVIRIISPASGDIQLPPNTERAVYTGNEPSASEQWRTVRCFPPARPDQAMGSAARSTVWGDAALIDQDLITQQQAVQEADNQSGDAVQFKAEWVRRSPEFEEWQRAETLTAERQKKLQQSVSFFKLNGLGSDAIDVSEPESGQMVIGTDAQLTARWARRGRSSRQAGNK